MGKSNLNNKSTSATTTTTTEECGEISHPPLSQSKLCDSFMEVGSLLYSACPDLFSNAMTQLSNQLSLTLVKNPSVLRPQSHSSSCEEQCSCAEAEETGAEPSSGRRTKERKSHTPFRKYVLPKDAPPEYYQCMDCGERRAENSFQNDHMHFGKKPKVRWFCPICQVFFAVTHRSGHIKCKHPCSESCSPVSSPSSTASSSCHTPEAVVPLAEGCKRCEPVSVGATSATLLLPPAPVQVKAEETELAPPAQKKRACDHAAGNESFESSPLFASPQEPVSAVNNNISFCSSEDDAAEDAPINRVPSTPSLFHTSSSSSAASFCAGGDDLLPVFRCPSYVLMPDNGSSDAVSRPSVDGASSGVFLFM